MPPASSDFLLSKLTAGESCYTIGVAQLTDKRIALNCADRSRAIATFPSTANVFTSFRKFPRNRLEAIAAGNGAIVLNMLMGKFSLFTSSTSPLLRPVMTASSRRTKNETGW